VEKERGLPLFVAVNAGCNLKCWYCTEHGENRSFGEGRLSAPRLMQVLEDAYACGIRTFRFTGGEPTKRQRLGEILLATQALGRDVRIAITTNGLHLDRLTPALDQLREPSVFLSVDGFAGDGAVPAPQGEFRIEKWLTPRLMQVIADLPPATRVRLNFVLTASTAPQLPALIDYAVDRGIDIKIFELLLRDFYYAGHRPRQDVFQEQYLPVRSLLPELQSRFGTPRPFAGTGGRGIPMRAFESGSSRIVYFDSAEGSHYGAVCDACPFFPCQEGLYALVLDANGTLHPAGCVNPLLKKQLGIASRESTRFAIEEMRETIEASTLRPVLPEFLRPSMSLV
jgi:molybdenum cofactor biosynthesis enzyme MoaA